MINARKKKILAVLNNATDGMIFFRKQEPLYPDFNKEHEEWQKQVLEKKPRFNPFGK